MHPGVAGLDDPDLPFFVFASGDPTQRAAAMEAGVLAIFALDDARGFVLSFVANRNALIAALFGVCALIAYDRWRRDGWTPGAWLTPLLLGAGLLSGEIALATTGFLFAHALCLDKGTLTADDKPRPRNIRLLWTGTAKSFASPAPSKIPRGASCSGTRDNSNPGYLLPSRAR